MQSVDIIEIELINRKRIIINKDWNRIYNICEKSYSTWHLTTKFPFISRQFHRYTTFKFQRYSNAKTYEDKHYRANCTLVQFASMFDVRLKPFEQARIEADLG